ncbi:hypothetical protein [Desulfatibacillum aliphaticivorans]|uniref:hypothetical protein n=1 Tax=Desulfatibacillum aliphaticivorans TaxID=218208 RepID=UPI0001601B2A|nr:hypothetical protein [Desulfatibacillum aliphaticivorans]
MEFAIILLLLRLVQLPYVSPLKIRCTVIMIQTDPNGQIKCNQERLGCKGAFDHSNDWKRTIWPDPAAQMQFTAQVFAVNDCSELSGGTVRPLRTPFGCVSYVAWRGFLSKKEKIFYSETIRTTAPVKDRR